MGTAEAGSARPEVNAATGRGSSPRWVALVVCVVAAAALYLFRIGQQSLWLDEVMSLAVASRPPAGMLDFFRGLPEQHPLYYVLLKGWIALLGDSELALRGLSVACAVLAIPLFHLLVRRLTSRPAAWIATVLLTLSPFWLFYAQEARMYTLVGFLAVLHSWLFLRWIASERSRDALWYVIVGVLGVYTHFFLVFVPLAHVVWHLFEEDDRTRALREVGPPVAAIYAAYLPWAVFLLLHMPEGQSWKGVRNVIFGVPYSFFRFSVGYSEFLANAGWKSRIPELVRANWLVIVAAGLGWGLPLLAGVRAAWRSGRRGRFLLAGLAVPIAAALLLSVRTIVVGERYFVVSFPFYLMVVAIGLWSMWRSGGAARTVGVTAAVLVAATTVNSLHGHYFEEDFGKEQWREVAHRVAADARDGDVVDFHHDFISGAFRYYYRQTSGPRLPATPEAPPPTSIEEGRLWLVVSHVLGESRCLEELSASFRPEESWHYPKGAGIELHFLVPRQGADADPVEIRSVLERSCS